MRQVRSWFLAVSLLVAATIVAPAQNTPSSAFEENRTYFWTADLQHSSIMFETGHWGVVDVVGWFEDYEVKVRSRKLDFSDALVEVRINPASVRMPNPAMAANLRNLFFQVQQFPEVSFQSTRVDAGNKNNHLRLSGQLTMKGVTHELVLDLSFNGYGSPPQGAPGFKLRGTLNRLDFGVGEMELMDGTGHPMVDAEVRLICNIRLEFVRSEWD